MPFSRSRSIESSTRSATSWLARKAPDCQSMASTSVVLPWSTWATMATFLRSSRTDISLDSRRSAAIDRRRAGWETALVPQAQERLAVLLDEVSTVTTGSGSLAAVTLALAAAMTGTAARPAGRAGLDAQADSLRRRAVALAVLEAESFASALEALHPEQHGLERPGDEAVETALDRGIQVLLQLAVLANDVSQLAAAVA